MFPKLLLALVLSIFLFIVYWGITTYYPEAFGLEIHPVPYMNPPSAAENVYAPMPPIPSMPAKPPMPLKNIPENTIPVVMASDPMQAPSEETQELRHPERLYEPAIKSKNTQIAVDSGVANPHVNTTAEALQVFSPEMAQNGGEFMEGVFPLDSTSDSSFATF
jgi:hypothetical protein